MPGKADFQFLVDWVNLPSPSPSLKRVIQVQFRQSVLEASTRVYEGHLRFTPARASRWMPEHFSGRAQLFGFSKSYWVDFAMAVSDKWAVAGFTWSNTGVWEELDVDHVDDYDSLLHVTFSPSSGPRVDAYMWGGIRIYDQDENVP